MYCIEKYKPLPAVLVIVVDNDDTNSTAFFSKKSYMYKPTIAPPPPLLLLLVYSNYVLCAKEPCALYTEGVAGEASKEAIDFECCLERLKLRTFVAALLSIWALANGIVKVSCLLMQKFLKVVNFATR